MSEVIRLPRTQETAVRLEERKPIQRYELSRPVTIKGKDVFGRAAQVTLEPAGKPGWFVNAAGRDVPISPSKLTTERHHLVLNYGGKKMRVVEHLLPLRITGLDGIRIVDHTEWLPYDGGGEIYLNACLPAMEKSGHLVPMQRELVGEHTVVEKNGLKRRVKLATDSKNNLLLRSTVNYPQFGGEDTVVRSYPAKSPNEMHDLFSSKPDGGSKVAEVAAKVASKFGWPHYDKVAWRKKAEGKAGFLSEVSRHRAFDMLGAMATVPGPGEYLTGTLESECGNHASDIAMLRKLAPRGGK